MIRMNVTIPEELVRELKHVKNKSHFIAEAVKERFAALRWKRLEASMIEGYKAAARDDKKMNEEWEQHTLQDGMDD